MTEREFIKKLEKDGSKDSKKVRRRLSTISKQYIQAKQQFENIENVSAERDKLIEQLTKLDLIQSSIISEFRSIKDPNLGALNRIITNIKSELEKEHEILTTKEAKAEKELAPFLTFKDFFTVSVERTVRTNNLKSVQNKLKKNKQKQEALESYIKQQRYLYDHMTESKRLMTGDSTDVLQKDINPEEFLSELREFKKTKKKQKKQLIDMGKQSSIEDLAKSEFMDDAKSEKAHSASVFSGAKVEVEESTPDISEKPISHVARPVEPEVSKAKQTEKAKHDDSIATLTIDTEYEKEVPKGTITSSEEVVDEDEVIKLKGLLDYYSKIELDVGSLKDDYYKYKAFFNPNLTDDEALKKFAENKKKFVFSLMLHSQKSSLEKDAMFFSKINLLNKFHLTAKNIAVDHYEKALVEVESYISSRKDITSFSSKNTIMSSLKEDLSELIKNIKETESEYEVDKLIREFSAKASENQKQLRKEHNKMRFIGFFSRRKPESSAAYIFRDLEKVSSHILCDEESKIRLNNSDEYSFAANKMLEKADKILKNAVSESLEYLIKREPKVEKVIKDEKHILMKKYFDKIELLQLKVRSAKEGRITLTDEELVDILKKVDSINTRYSSKLNIIEKSKWFSSSASNIFAQTSKELNKMKVKKQGPQIIGIRRPKIR